MGVHCAAHAYLFVCSFVCLINLDLDLMISFDFIWLDLTCLDLSDRSIDRLMYFVVAGGYVAEWCSNDWNTWWCECRDDRRDGSGEHFHLWNESRWSWSSACKRVWKSLFVVLSLRLQRRRQRTGIWHVLPAVCWRSWILFAGCVITLPV